MTGKEEQRADDELSLEQRDQALTTVLTYTFFKVMMDCSTIAVWPLLLKDLFPGDLALAAAVASTTSSICGVAELVVTPAVGKLSDRFGRRPFFLIGPLANVVVSLLQIRWQRSLAMAYVQRIVGQSLSTLSGTTISSATISDVASGDKLSQALGGMVSSIGLGLSAGPFLVGLVLTRFPAEQQTRIGYAMRAGISALAALFLALRMPETLPRSRRRPFRLRDVNPFGFLRLFRGGAPSALRRLCVAIGLGSLMEGKMTTDILMLTLRENVGLASGMINNYLAVLGVVTFISGRFLVRLLLSVLGPRRFTDVSLGLSVAGHTLMGAVAGQGKVWAVWAQMALIAPGTNNLCSVSMKSQATAHAVGPECDMGRYLRLFTQTAPLVLCELSLRVPRGEFAAALSSMRALAQVVGPALWGRAYMQLLRTGYPPSWVWVCVAGLGALVPAAVHRSIKGEEWEPKQA